VAEAMVKRDRQQAPSRDQPTGGENGSGARQHDVVGADEVNGRSQRPAPDKAFDPRVRRSISEG
jgi:hypothetical protein